MPKNLLPESVDRYLTQTFGDEPACLKALRDETASMPEAGYQIAADQGQFLAMLVHLIGAKRTLEIGVFTGYSSLAVLLALPVDGTHVALDISREFTDVARRHWDLAGVGAKATLMVGPALESLEQIQSQGDQFDFCFIDADKPNYCAYYESAVQLVRSNGLIVIDNVLWSGKVADPEDRTESTVAIRQLNEWVARDQRVQSCLVPIGDGLLLARKK